MEKILRENNRFNNTLGLIAEAGYAEEQDVIQRIRVAQGEALTAVADIANLLRDGKVNEAMTLQRAKVILFTNRSRGWLIRSSSLSSRR